MKKFLLLVLFFALSCGLSLRAQNTTTPSVNVDRNKNFTLIKILNSNNWPYDISENKQHVVIQGFGAVDGYYWSDSTGIIAMSGYPFAVSDNGIVAGTYTNGLGISVGGLWSPKTKKWEFLGMNPDMPEYSSEPGATDYNGAWSMTNDGNVVGVMQIYPDWSTSSYLWTRDNGYKKISNGVSSQTRPNAISDDGKVVAGYAAHETKGQWTPCYWVDGEIYRFPHLFGEALNVSHNGNYVCGYLLNSKCFIKDIANNKVVEITNTLEPGNSLSATCITDNGTAFGHSDGGSPIERNAFAYVGGELMTFTEYLVHNGIEEAANWKIYSITNVTSDGKTFIGGGVINGEECSFVLTVENTACEAPKNLTYNIKQDSYNNLVLNWEAPEDAENVTYNIYTSYSSAPLANNITETTFTLDNLQPGEYQFFVRASYNNGECLSEISNTVRPTIYACAENEKCELTVLATDYEYGDKVADGWDFGYISIKGSLSDIEYKVELTDGGKPSNPEIIKLDLCPDTYQFTWVPGDWDEEVGFTIIFQDEELYRLNFGDIDTTFKKKPMFFEYAIDCEPSVGIDETTTPETLDIYPNPVNDRLYIETENNVKNVTIFDIFGRQQQLSAISSQPYVINVSNLTSGIYFVKINTTNGEIVKRFVKK